MKEELKQQIQKIAQTYGYDAQSRQCMEEMAELTQAINKFWRKELACGRNFSYLCEDMASHPSEGYENLIEELADVKIMLAQMEYFLFAEEKVSEEMGKKVLRQIGRIEAEGRAVHAAGMCKNKTLPGKK